MAKGIIMAGGGGGTGSDEVTATKDKVLSGYTAVTSDSADEAAAGTMPNNGAQNGSLNCGQSKTIPAGYTPGGTVKANSLASQTGVDSGKAAAGAAQILAGYQAWVNGNKVSGSMANQGAKTAALNCGGSYTIPAGYHNGSGKVTANSLASQTEANAIAAHILKGETAWVDGVKVTGTMEVQSVLSFSAAALTHDTIRISWRNPAKGPWQGVKIRMATSGHPGTGGGTLKYTGTGSSAAAGAASYVDITGLTPNTTYYFTCCSYATGLGESSGSNVSAKTTLLYLYRRGNNVAQFEDKHQGSYGKIYFGSDKIYWTGGSTSSSSDNVSSFRIRAKIPFDIRSYSILKMKYKVWGGQYDIARLQPVSIPQDDGTVKNITKSVQLLWGNAQENLCVVEGEAILTTNWERYANGNIQLTISSGSTVGSSSPGYISGEVYEIWVE